MTGTAPSDTPPPHVASSWQRLSLKTKALLVALVTVLAGFGTIKNEALRPIWEMYSHRQPAYDAKVLSSLEPGIFLPEFQKRLGRESTAILRPYVPVIGPGGDPAPTRDVLFILETAFVEAFVDDTQTVRAYTITVQVPDAPSPIKVGSAVIEFGKTTIASASIGPVDIVAGACGAHIFAYYEVSGNSNAQNAQRLAVGHTAAGYYDEPAEWSVDTLLCPDIDAAPYEPLYVAPPSDEALYVADLYQPDSDTLQAQADVRGRTLVNTVSITAPGTELAPEMLSLHPDFANDFEQS